MSSLRLFSQSYNVTHLKKVGNNEKNQLRALLKIRREERDKYDHAYFRNDYWKEDLLGSSGNRGLSYTDPEHNCRFDIWTNTLINTIEFKSILDAGCGPGILINKLAQSGKEATGCDFSNAARELFIYNNDVPGANFVNSTITELPFPDNSFDLVFCSDVMEHLPFLDVHTAVKELMRVAKNHIVYTINTDNPYLYHPTVLSRRNWESIFEFHSLTKCISLEENLNNQINRSYEEYDIFVYTKKSAC